MNSHTLNKNERGSTPMLYTLGQAAHATGKAKGTIKNAIDKGRISASRDDNGNYQIDASELHRVYLPVQQGDKMNAVAPPLNTAEIDTLNAKISMLTDMLERERSNADEWRAQAQRLALSYEKRSGWFDWLRGKIK